jgi:hypothetical protein
MSIAAIMMPAEQEIYGWQGEPSAGIPDDATYFALEHYLYDEASGLRIDQYDGCDLSGRGVLTLIDKLKQALVDLNQSRRIG